jgi:hypothetical protein
MVAGGMKTLGVSVLSLHPPAETTHGRSVLSVASALQAALASPLGTKQLQVVLFEPDSTSSKKWP